MVFIPSRIPEPFRSDPKLTRLIGEVGNFARMHKVQDKDSKREIDFVSLPMQDKIFAAVEAGHNRIAIIKARQTAATTGCKMVLHHMAYSTPHAAMHAVVSMRDDSATALLDDSRRWLEHPPAIFRRPIKTKARGQIVYRDTGASLQAFTSRSQTGLRSFSPAAVLISEAAYAPDLEEVVAQADAAVGNGLLIMESTARNPGDFFSSIIKGSPENGWHVITMWWHEHPAYEDSPDMIPDGFEAGLSATEKALRTEYGLTLGQLHWRARTAARVGSDHKFRKEYPSNMDDCFLAREGGYLADTDMSWIHVVDHIIHGKHHGRELEAPHSQDLYVMGVDVGGGVGGDYSTLAVISISTMQPVYTERSNTVDPAAWAHRCIQVGTRYNNALMLAESNNHGHAFLLETNSCGYKNQWRNPKNGKPWTTSMQSKLDAYATLRESLPIIKMMDRTTWLELRSLTIAPGKITPEAPTGSYDDSAIAIALAYRCLRDIPASWRTIAQASNRNRFESLIATSRARRLRSNNLPF